LRASSVDSGNDAHSPCVSVERGVPQESASEFSSPIVANIQPHQAIASLLPIRPVKVAVQGEEGRIPQFVQNRYQVFVFGAAGGDFHTNRIRQLRSF